MVWGDHTPDQDQDVTKIEIRSYSDGTKRMHAYTEGGAFGWKHEGWFQGYAADDDMITDWLRMVRDCHNFQPGTNGYYVEWSVGDAGERGTGGYDPETGQYKGIAFVIWRAP